MANEKIKLGASAGFAKPAVISLPVDYATNTTKNYPLILYIGGNGEQTEATLLSYGPNAMIQNKSRVFDDIITISFAPGMYAPINYLNSVLDEIFSTYRVDKTKVGLTGLSSGGQLINRYASDVNYGKKVQSVYSLQAVPMDEGPARMANFARNGGRWYGVEGGSPKEYRGGDLMAKAMNDAVPGSAQLRIIPAGQPGYEHGDWDKMYDLSFFNWVEWMFGKSVVVPVPVDPIPVPTPKTLLMTIKVYTDGTSETIKA